jgi:hypothetical protein
VTVNGKSAAWRVLDNSVGEPRVALTAPAAVRHHVEIRWSGSVLSSRPAEVAVAANAVVTLNAGGAVREMADPQGALAGPEIVGDSVRGVAAGTPGHRTVFARRQQGDLAWWQPLAFEIRPAREPAPVVFTTDWRTPLPARTRLESVPLASLFNDQVSQIFRHDYRSPRSPFCSLATPQQGFGSWCKPAHLFEVDDSGLRAAAAAAGGKITLPNGVTFATPGEPAARNVAFVSQWDNFPREITAPLGGQARTIFLLVAGTTHAMQSRCDNGEVIISYADGSATRLPLHNPTTWWPIDQDYFIDDLAFARPGPLPPRLDLKTGRFRILDPAPFKGQGRSVPGGAATVLDLSLDPAKELKSLTIRALANEVVLGLLSATLERR